jgi:hypothetical protein
VQSVVQAVLLYRTPCCSSASSRSGASNEPSSCQLTRCHALCRTVLSSTVQDSVTLCETDYAEDDLSASIVENERKCWTGISSAAACQLFRYFAHPMHSNLLITLHLPGCFYSPNPALPANSTPILNVPLRATCRSPSSFRLPSPLPYHLRLRPLLR